MCLYAGCVELPDAPAHSICARVSVNVSQSSETARRAKVTASGTIFQGCLANLRGRLWCNPL